jgi:hypothetical protein
MAGWKAEGLMSLLAMPHWAIAAGADATASTSAIRAGAELQFVDLMCFLLGRGNLRAAHEGKRGVRQSGNEEEVKGGVKFR